MPYDESAVLMARDMLIIIIGLLVSIVQAVTSIQDQTITFVPKIVVMIIVAALLLPWITSKLVEYSAQLLWLVSNP
jgi:flagellar biosynthetic protein FliQ